VVWSMSQPSMSRQEATEVHKCWYCSVFLPTDGVGDGYTECLLGIEWSSSLQMHSRDFITRPRLLVLCSQPLRPPLAALRNWSLRFVLCAAGELLRNELPSRMELLPSIPKLLRPLPRLAPRSMPRPMLWLKLMLLEFWATLGTAVLGRPELRRPKLRRPVLRRAL
jgi:hypothetical protein